MLLIEALPLVWSDGNRMAVIVSLCDSIAV
jgi:hypothetical protein